MKIISTKIIPTQNKFELQYKKVLRTCLKTGGYRADRTKIGSYSIFDVNFRINIKDYFPIITGRKISSKIFNIETDWFINGETNIARFTKNNIKIWDNWADKNGDLGPVYGYQMINFNNNNINQLKQVIKTIKSTPDSRRHIILLWNPIQLHQMRLPPCYLYFQFYVMNGILNMFVVQRSADLFLGVPYDICLFSKFLNYVAVKTNLEVGEISVNLVDAHIYMNQIIAIKKYLKTKIFPLPTYKYVDQKIILNNYIFDKIIKCKVAV